MTMPHLLAGNSLAMGRSVTVDPSVQAHAEAAVQARTGAEVSFSVLWSCSGFIGFDQLKIVIRQAVERFRPLPAGGRSGWARCCR